MASVSSSEDAQPSSFELLLLEEATPFRAVNIASAWTVSSRHLSKGRVGDRDPRKQAVTPDHCVHTRVLKLVIYDATQVAIYAPSSSSIG
jgi:hypothetical protein